jgi:hypothetical protein
MIITREFYTMKIGFKLLGGNLRCSITKCDIIKVRVQRVMIEEHCKYDQNIRDKERNCM